MTSSSGTMSLKEAGGHAQSYLVRPENKDLKFKRPEP